MDNILSGSSESARDSPIDAKKIPTNLAKKLPRTGEIIRKKLKMKTLMISRMELPNRTWKESNEDVFNEKEKQVAQMVRSVSRGSRLSSQVSLPTQQPDRELVPSLQSEWRVTQQTPQLGGAIIRGIHRSGGGSGNWRKEVSAIVSLD